MSDSGTGLFFVSPWLVVCGGNDSLVHRNLHCLIFMKGDRNDWFFSLGMSSLLD